MEETCNPPRAVYPDEATVSDRVLREGVEAPDLATVKDFLRFHAATSKDLIKKQIAADSLTGGASHGLAATLSELPACSAFACLRPPVSSSASDTLTNASWVHIRRSFHIDGARPISMH